MTSVVVSDGGGNIVEYVTVVEDPQRVSQQSLSMKKDVNSVEKNNGVNSYILYTSVYDK